LIYYKTVNNGKNFQYKEKRRNYVLWRGVSSSYTAGYDGGKRFQMG